MDQTDRDNLHFIMSCDGEQLKNWWETISEENREYAINLVRNYRQWIEQQSSEYLEQQECELADSNWIESQTVIEKIMRKK